MRINYDRYHFSKMEMVRYGIEGLCICIIVNYLCYRTLWAFLLSLPFVLFYLKRKRQIKIMQRREKLRIQFKDALHGLAIAMGAGYSMENALRASLADLRTLYRKDDPIVREFIYIQKQMKLSVPIEKLFIDLGKRSGLEDIQNFAGIYAIAKKSGGNLNAILGKTTQMIEGKIETEKEIIASISAKRMEQIIMSIVPCGIILYVQLTSPGFMDVLYGNMVGIVVMTACLFLYILAFCLGKKIMEIEV